MISGAKEASTPKGWTKEAQWDFCSSILEAQMRASSHFSHNSKVTFGCFQIFLTNFLLFPSKQVSLCPNNFWTNFQFLKNWKWIVQMQPLWLTRVLQFSIFHRSSHILAKEKTRTKKWIRLLTYMIKYYTTRSMFK